MSLFLADVRVFDVRFDWPDATSKAVIEGVTGKDGTTVHITKHSNGDEFLAVPICAIVFTFIYLIIKAIMAPFTQRARLAAKQAANGNGGGLTQEEVAVLQKLQRTLSQMESRVEALETILIETARTEKKYGSKL